MANLTLGNKTVVTQAGSAEPVLASNVNLSNANLSNTPFPAGHVVQTKFNQIAAFTSGESLTNTTNKTVRGKTAITISDGNSIIVGVSIDEIIPAVSAGKYISFVMNASTTDPGLTVDNETTGSNLFYPVPGGGYGNIDVTIGYYASGTSTRYSGMHFVTALNNPGAGTYYIWFLVYNNGANATTFNIGVNGETKLEIREIVGSLS